MSTAVVNIIGEGSKTCSIVDSIDNDKYNIFVHPTSGREFIAEHDSSGHWNEIPTRVLLSSLLYRDVTREKIVEVTALLSSIR